MQEGTVDVGGAAVNDGFVAAMHHPHPHLLLQDAGNHLRFHGNGVFPIAITIRDVQGIDVVGTVGRDFNDLAAQGPGQWSILPFRVNDDNVVVCCQGNIGNGGFHSHRLAGAGDAQVKGVGRNEPLPVTDQQVFTYSVHTIVQTAGVLDLLGTEGHEHGGALRGQRPQGFHPAQAIGQHRIQSILLLIPQHRKLA